MPRESQLHSRGTGDRRGGASAVVVVAAAAAATLPQSGIAAPNNFKRLQFVPARRKEASPPPSHSVPIVRLDVPEPLPDKKNVKEAMAREKSASNTAAAAAAAAVVASAVAAAAGKKKKNAKTSSSRPPARELFPSASFQMRWAEPLKPVRIGVLYACFLVCVGGGRERPERERHRNEKKENPETKKNSPLSLSFSLSLSRCIHHHHHRRQQQQKNRAPASRTSATPAS